jgi:hypothetical protein
MLAWPVAGTQGTKSVYKAEEVHLNETGRADGRCFELTLDCVQLWALVLAVRNLRVLRPVI